MQVLSQLSYNPTIGPLIGADIVAPARPGSSPSCSTGEFHASSSPASTNPGSLRTMGSAYCSRVTASRGVYQPGLGSLNSAPAFQRAG
jgi:hypothetical protein